MKATEMQRLTAQVEGRVQGVGFRYFVLDTAQALGLAGWVANRWDGSVVVVAEGPRPVLDKLVAALWKGPRMAFVTQVRQTWDEAQGEYAGFEVRGNV